MTIMSKFTLIVVAYGILFALLSHVRIRGESQSAKVKEDNSVSKDLSNESGSTNLRYGFRPPPVEPWQRGPPSIRPGQRRSPVGPGQRGSPPIGPRQRGSILGGPGQRGLPPGGPGQRGPPFYDSPYQPYQPSPSGLPGPVPGQRQYDQTPIVPGPGKVRPGIPESAAEAEGAAEAEAGYRPAPNPYSLVSCIACTNCRLTFDAPQKLCPFSYDDSKNGKCVTYAEKYKHDKNLVYVRGCATERGSCIEINDAHIQSNVDLVMCEECIGDNCNDSTSGAMLVSHSRAMAVIMFIITPLLGKLTMS